MTDFPEVLKAEIAGLEKDIRDNPDPRHRKLARLRDTLAEYEPRKNEPPAKALGQPRIRILLPHSALSKSSRMLIQIEKLLSENERVHRKDILAHLIKAGIMGKEKNPLQALAIFLSAHKDKFAFDGAGNYSRRAAG